MASKLRWISLVLALAPACKTAVPAPEVPGAGALSPDEARASWSAVLETAVDDAGRIDFEGVRARPAELETFVAWVGAVGPRTRPEWFPKTSDRVAYYVDAYNALAMYNVLHAGVLPKSKVRFFWLRELRIDGRRISLYDLENDVIRPLGEPRVHFALNCMVRGCPRLPREPFGAGDLDQRLEAAAREFFGDPRHARFESGAVRLSKILDWYDEDFLAVAPSLVDYANRYRSEPLPADAKVRFLEYDWTLNQR
jgi:hypothetical protein